MLTLPRAIVLAAFIGLLAVPFAFRPQEAAPPAGALRLVVITPHNEQIRYEFGRAFSEWHQARYDRPVAVDFRAPGGTSEIRKLLVAVYEQALKSGQLAPDGSITAGTMPYDILFGGGAYEHDIIKRGVAVGPPGSPSISISIPAPFSTRQVSDWFGENAIGSDRLYDPDLHWLGVALTSFGIVYNRDVLERLSLPEPTTWERLADPRYAGWLAMTDPRQSSSVAVTYDSILNNYGWEKGWRILLAMGANARFFANSSLKPPLEVSRAEAAAGPSLDFYGRFQAQALIDAKSSERADRARVGYIDPPGIVFINADPISILRAGPNPEIAARFVEFTCSLEGQALWQFPAKGESAPAETLGPRRYELRKLPGRRALYADFRDRFVDRDVDPFRDASNATINGWFRIIERVFGAAAIDIHADQREAWSAIHAAESRGADPAAIAQLLDLFFSLPNHPFPDNSSLPLTPEHIKPILDDWRNPDREATLRMHYTAFFLANYHEVTRRAAELP
ncbi:MAG: extracellular solute-binding protein [Phycisphaerales bacterium]|nr:extracellular solute-binding protein [Phycisphaerales bacterium]